ncbi:hypothetical protein DEU56DRAFT_919714 [Suillus clintonianus]|uniref:uncharacterized protein n=1 Tax=Suillus clintonianus TaxID=1904413 RepID=UPI001B85ED46|nr:uncharacterized protein DEU56DRAFT_919714 [Suillus clintonianus]KAG2113383.1 hypothetical protein DEU56DRAFT_919714 [Suillus clintonianus]
MAARNFEDLLQCAIPVFDGLFPATQNQIVQDLLFTLAHWHGLSKLRMHSDLTLDILDATTTDIGNQLRDFKVKDSFLQPADLQDPRSETMCLVFDTSEQPTLTVLNRENWNTALARDDILEQIGNPSYASSLKLSVAKPVLGVSRIVLKNQELSNDDIGSYLRLHEGDPAMKNYFSRLKEHLLLRILTSQPGDSCQQAEGGTDQVLFKHNRIYHHNIARFNYTTYDTRRDQDVINPKTSHRDIMLLNSTSDNSDCGGRYHYARVLGVHHVNIVYTGGPYHTALRMEFLFVRWYEPVGHANPGRTALDRLYFPALDSEDAFGFLSPADVMRAAHIIPCFSKEMRHKDGKGLSGIAGDKSDWCQYFVNRFVDRDMLMCFHYGLGVGHVYSHEEALNPPPKTISLNEAPCNEHVGGNEYEPEDALEDDHTGVEEGDIFDQEKNQSSELIVEELDDMVPPLVPDFTVQGLQFDLLKNEVYGEWEEFVHLSGATYYYNRTRKAYTGFNVRDCSSDCLDKFEAWVKATRARAHEDLLLVAEPVRTQNVDGDVYLYYLVALEARIIGWLETFDGTHLFRECDSARQWNHKRLELEAQFWKHVEFFPRDFKLDHIFLRQLRTELDWFHAASLDDLSESEGIITEPGVALLGRLYHMLRHHQYLNYFGQPEARLLRTHSMGPGTRMQGPFPFILTVAMLCLPVLVRERLKQIYVDGLVNYLDLKDFINDFNIQNNAQITLAGVIMVINAGFLAVQGVGTGLVAESMLKGSIIFCVGCLFAGMFNGGGPVPKVLNVAAR